ncbi:hypothetical protein BMS3Bbin02_00853 [bacterium BMS3Bbin02]|nr:hypothetical protein BMS3Bbin02_00853 [bacterium BMS3Bbin02]HDH26776.1 hypothetical protein [Actinomycetota bacterium]
MFMRVRWFVLGVIATVSGGVVAAAKLRRAREALNARNAAKIGVRGVAGVIDRVADGVSPAKPNQQP